MATLKTLAATLSEVAGVEVELTIRAAGKFTVSAEGDARTAFAAIVKYFGKLAKWDSIEYDLECDFTCGYFAAGM